LTNTLYKKLSYRRETARQLHASFWARSLIVHYYRPHSLRSLSNFALKLTTRKLESWGYPPVKTTWS